MTRVQWIQLANGQLTRGFHRLQSDNTVSKLDVGTYVYLYIVLISHICWVYNKVGDETPTLCLAIHQVHIVSLIVIVICLIVRFVDRPRCRFISVSLPRRQLKCWSDYLSHACSTCRNTSRVGSVYPVVDKCSNT